MTTVLVSAADASGDAHAAGLVRALRARRPELRFVGMGGAELARAGVEIAVAQSALAVGGLFELLPHLSRIVRARRELAAALRAARPALAVLVDASGFHLPFARRARRAGVPVLYYVSPQVWAWRRGRVRALARHVDRLAAILPFEAKAYAGSGLAVEYVGHPLVERVAPCPDPGRARAALGLPPDGPVAALLPGSRENELRSNLDVLLAAARQLHAREPDLRCVLPLAPAVARVAGFARARAARLASGLPLAIVDGRSLEVLAACDVALVKPGTATLEAALLGRPLVVVARTHPLTALVLRRLVTVDCTAMPNLILGERVVPELLQQDADPVRVAEAAQALLAGPAREAQLRHLARVREALGPPGASQRAAALAEELLPARAHP